MRDLQPLFAPASVAVIGASDDPMKWGGWFTGSLLEQPGHPRIHLVSRRGGTIRGQVAYPSIHDLPERPELVVLAVPAAHVDGAVDDALAMGARAIVVIAAGFAEGGADGLARERAIVARVRAAGAVLLGPNCLGLLDSDAGLNATGGAHARGSVSLASQSGNLALELGILLEHEGLGFARLASVGNQADIGVADVLWSLVDHEPTRVVTAYVEDPGDGASFLTAVRALAEAGKPPLLMKAGRTAIGARAAQSHTGALAGSSRVFEAAVRDAGGIIVASPGDVVDRAKALLGGARLRGRRIAVVADGGGHGVLAADMLDEAGLEVAVLGPAAAAAIAPSLPNSEPVNPIDLAGAGEQDIRSFARITAALMAADEVDGVLFSGYFGGYAGYSPEAGAIEIDVARELAAMRDATGKPLLVHSMQVVKRMPGIAELDRLGVPTYARVEEALHGLDALVPRAPAPLATAGPAPGTPAGAGAYHDARAVLAAAGIPFPDGALAADDDDVARIATGLGGTVALKAVSADLLHKSDAGGVALSLATPDAARHGAVAMRARVRAARPDVVLDGVFVERMAEPGGVDLVVGAHRDPTFGPVILVGVGGIFVEILDDVVLAVAPADPGHVERLIGELKAAPLLAGARGSRPVDVAAIARAACTLGDLLLARPEILEVEINPLRASFAGILALDARIVVAR